MKEQLKKMRYKGLCCGMAPVFVEFYQEHEDDPMICAMAPRPKTGWLLSATTWTWDFVAWVSGRHAFAGQYSVRVTGPNPYYITEEDTDELHNRQI